MIAPARVAAYNILCKVSAGRADLPAAIAGERPSLADSRDRALAAEITTGVQRQRAALDHLIKHFAKREIDRLDPEIVEILRLSLYQLLHLTRVPAPAVVDDAVDLAGRAGKRSAAGFVNAVLRSATRTRRNLPLPPKPSDPRDAHAALDYLSVTLSHPRWLVARWYERFGFDATERWLLFNNTAAPLTLRANRLLTTRDDLKRHLAAEGIDTAPARFAPDALTVESGNAGDSVWFVVQDEASQLVALLAGAAPGRWVLDACAAPGGKATAIAAGLLPDGRLVACDLRARRVDLLRRTVQASGAANILVVRADLLAPLPFSSSFDCVIVDAPCSGLGVLRRDPDIRWRRAEEELAPLAAAQLQMLQHAATAVAPGGRLVYATCSSEPEENELVVETFLRGTDEFVGVDARRAHPLLPGDVVDARGYLQTSPHLHGLDGFFGAVLEKRPPRDL